MEQLCNVIEKAEQSKKSLNGLLGSDEKCNISIRDIFYPVQAYKTIKSTSCQQILLKVQNNKINHDNRAEKKVQAQFGLDGERRRDQSITHAIEFSSTIEACVSYALYKRPFFS